MDRRQLDVADDHPRIAQVIIQFVVLLAKVTGECRRVWLSGEGNVRPCRGYAVQRIEWYLGQCRLACLTGIADTILVAIALIGVGNAGTVVASIVAAAVVGVTVRTVR